MTTANQTAKMIYDQETVANMILGKMKKRYPERQYTLCKISSGWQVVGITKLPDYMPPAKPLPVMFGLDLAKGSSTSVEALVFEFPYQRETKAWWYFDGGETGVNWIHKNHCISAEIVHEPGKLNTIRIKVSKKIALEKGLVKKEAA